MARGQLDLVLIADLLREKDLSRRRFYQKVVAVFEARDLLAYSPTAIKSVLDGKTQPQSILLSVFSEVLGVSMNRLYGDGKAV